MKLRDLAKGSGDPTSFIPAIHMCWFRFGNQETSRRSRKSYESVPRSSSALRFLTLLQQATMVLVLSILRRPCRPRPPVTLLVRTCHRYQNVRQCTCHRPTSFRLSPNFEQNQRKVYHEILIAGDLSEEDVNKIKDRDPWHIFPDPDSAEFVYGNDTANMVYFAQPSVSQFVPGGSGPGDVSNFRPVGLRKHLNDTFALRGRNTTRNDTGAVLRYASPAC